MTSLSLTKEQEAMTWQELENYFQKEAPPPKDENELRARKDVVFRQRIIQTEDLNNKTVAEMDKIMTTFTGRRGGAIRSRIRAEKLRAEQEAARVADFEKRHADWAAMGKPANWLTGVNDKIVGFKDVDSFQIKEDKM